MLPCVNCYSAGYCKQISANLVSDSEISNPQFVFDVRVTTSSMKVSPADWLETIYDLYRDYVGVILDDQGNETFINMEVFEFPHAREWFRDWVCIKPQIRNRIRVRVESRERFRALATIIRAAYPKSTDFWGLSIANDP